MSNSRRIDNNTFGDNARIHQGDVHNVHNYPQERRETPPPPSQLIPFPRDPDFVNRGDILDKISARCLKPGGRVALVGLGGVGKSQLAIEFAHRLADKHKNIWVFWIHAATQQRVQEGFRLIADAVKLPERKQPQADIPRHVYEWLSIEHNGRWVIILDSADDSEVLYSPYQSGNDKRSLAACIPGTRNGSIVLTTRNKSLASKLTGRNKDIIDVDTMSKADALTLLERKMGSPLSPSEAGSAKDLVKALEFIPLAISQAAAYIQARRPRSSIEKYLAEFRNSDRGSMKLLKHEANDIGRDEETSNTVLRTWAMSFDYIRSRQQSAADLLSRMSFFDRQRILDWVLKGFTMQSNSLDETETPESGAGASKNDNSSSFEEDISILRNYCLITMNKEGNEFEMHRLVQLSIKGWLKAAGLKEGFMQQYITRMVESFPVGKYENWAICQDLFAHVQVAFDYQPNACEDTLKQWVTLCIRGGHYAYEKGKYDLAEQMLEKSKKVCEMNYGKENKRTLQSISLLAAILICQGRLDEAEELELRVIKARKIKPGADHRDTLADMGNLAAIYRKQGRRAEAEELEVQVAEARKTKLGAEHRHTLMSMSHLASMFKEQGRLDEAEKLEVQALEIRRRTLGTNHPNTVMNMTNLVSIYRKQGRLDEAEKLQVQALEARKETLGDNHPATLTSMCNLASIYGEQGRSDEAEKLQMQALDAHKSSLGTDHPETLMDMYNLAFTWMDQGRDEDALALMKDCLQRRQRVLGLQHPHTVEALETVEAWSNEDEEEETDEDD